VPRIYVAGPLFTPQDRGVLELVAQTIKALGHQPVLPHAEQPLTPFKDAADAKARQGALIRLIDGSDAVVALLDGLDVDGGTSFEIGYARALNRPILGLRSDLRTGGERDGLNLMVAHALNERADVKEWTTATLKPLLERFLSSVRVFAGRLIRDGVPRLIKESGQTIATTQVAPQALPKVLKRRLVEVARRLEAAEWGPEQEEVAELLEVLEALIRVRAYDKESLRAIKEGTWRKKGGYEKGYVVDEEPKLS
jgi:nucleoside 2-deoxyribosyltransferase